MISAGALLNDAVLPVFSRPSDPFAEAVWCTELEAAAGELARVMNRRFHDLVNRIAAEGLVSERYVVTFPAVAVRRVDVVRLREELPEVFDRVVYLRCCDAERILSRERLYALCCAEAGGRVPSLEQVNLGDLGRVLKGEEMDRYVIVEEKPCRPVVTRLTGGAV